MILAKLRLDISFSYAADALAASVDSALSGGKTK
jgi:hypothetical protein